MKTSRVAAILGLGFVLISLSGCAGQRLGWWSWFDPSKLIHKKERAVVNPIYSQVGPTDQTSDVFPNATFPTVDDLQYKEEDYIIGPNDVLRISVLDLLQEGVETVMERQVSQSGYIDLILGGSMKASGLTKDQLTEQIKKAYMDNNVLKTPAVSVTVLVARQDIFSILGAVTKPGTYAIPRRNFTLLEALAMAGGITQMNIPWIYVLRPKEKQGGVQQDHTGVQPLPPLPTIPEEPPATVPTTAPSKPVSKKTELEELEKAVVGTAAGREKSSRRASDKTKPTTSPVTSSAPADLSTAATGVSYDWVYSQGRWITVPRSKEKGPTTVATAPTLLKEMKDKYGWSKYDLSDTTRIIAIDRARLEAMDPMMNIIIRKNDIIEVPPLQVGEFYVMGEVLRPGVYSLTGRKVTVKMAVAAAGNLGPLSWPTNSVLIRRVGGDKEQIIPLNIQEIFEGKQPDLFLKPDDVIAVGTYWGAPFLAVWRNAFRMTYGFGFIYDRNYSEREFEIPIFWPKPGYRPF